MKKDALLKRAQRFSEYSELKDINPSSFSIPSEDSSPTNPLITEIFAPDPVTHLPHSDLHIVMSNDSRPEVAQFIRDQLMQPLGDCVRTDNEDDALEMVKSRHESFVEYAERLRSFCESVNKEKYE